MDALESKNPYAILGVEHGHLASQDDIKKARRWLLRPRFLQCPLTCLAADGVAARLPSPLAQAYKKMVLLKHPDKRRGDPNAAAEFDELKKAYELLTDEQAKGAYDDLVK
jgi:curved DNA-binding protein CbpA